MLSRAGDHFDNEVRSEEDYDGDIVILPLRHALPKKAVKPIRMMIRGMARKHDWKVKKVEFYKDRVIFVTAPELGLKLPGSPRRTHRGQS